MKPNKKVWKIVDKAVDKMIKNILTQKAQQNTQTVYSVNKQVNNTHYELLSVKNKIKYMNSE